MRVVIIEVVESPIAAGRALAIKRNTRRGQDLIDRGRHGGGYYEAHGDNREPEGSSCRRLMCRQMQRKASMPSSGRVEGLVR